MKKHTGGSSRRIAPRKERGREGGRGPAMPGQLSGSCIVRELKLSSYFTGRLG